jgi:uncharacterized membrane protein
MDVPQQDAAPRGSGAIRTTIVGGLLFLIPFVVAVVIAGKALQIMRMVAKPIVEVMGVDRVVMVAMIDVVAIVLLVGLCYLAGRIAVSERGRRVYRALDERLLDIFPRYGFVKAIASGVAKDRAQQIRPVIVRFDDLEQFAFEVERDGSRVVVYLPGSPDPWSGSVALVETGRVTPVAADVPGVLKSLRGAGRGALAVLAGGVRESEPAADRLDA